MASCRICLHDSVSCRDSQQEGQSRRQSQQEAIFTDSNPSRESTRSRTVLAEAKYDGQSRQEAKIGGLVYTPILSVMWDYLFMYSVYEDVV